MLAGLRLRREAGAPVRTAASPRPGVPSKFEPALLTAGLLVSLAAGFAARRALGPYGDGPFGGGFRRIPAASPGETLLVHDSRSGVDTVRAVIDEATGRVAEVRLAPGGDFARALRVLLDEGGSARVARDLDGDGATDRWDHYADARAVGSGEIEKVGFSGAGDGIEDSWAFFDDQGEIRRVEVSTRRDGKVDRWEHYREGALARVETDSDGDGRVDHVSTYEHGVPVRDAPASGAVRPGVPRPRER